MTHGGDASPSFQIPDYRGVFLRGVNGGSGRDPDAARRTAAGKDGAGNAGDTVGSRQADALQTHRHAVTWDFYAVGTNRTRDVEEGDEKLNAHTNERFSLSVLDPTGARTSSETRPVNVAVHWMIKAR